jgi:hypothetical protein
MFKIIKICKIIFIAFAVSIVGDFIASLILDILGPLDQIQHISGNSKYYVPLFFSRLAKDSFFYLCTMAIEKWCVKNDVK